MSIKDVLEKIHNAENVQISISAEEWNMLGSNASVVKLEGNPEEVSNEAATFISGDQFSSEKTVAFVLFCNPEDSLSTITAIPAEAISKAGLKTLYSVCCNPTDVGTVELYIIYN